MDDLGQFLRERREAMKLSQEEVGELAGVSGGYVAHVERGDRNPRAWVLTGILRALNLTRQELHMAGYPETAALLTGPAEDRQARLRDILAEYPVRPSLRALVERAIVDAAADADQEAIRQRAQEAWEYAHQPLGAYGGQITREQYERQAFERFMRKMYGIEVFRDGPGP
jgi:transcriptional regulator with XRE-family HTH domain